MNKTIEKIIKEIRRNLSKLENTTTGKCDLACELLIKEKKIGKIKKWT